MKRGALFFIFGIICSLALKAQPFSRMDLPFFKDGRRLSKALVGGLNNPQLSSADLNGDGRLDLYIFDRTGEVHLPFLRTQDQFVFAPSFATFFPPAREWVLLRDYNGDAAVDLFAYSDAPGIPGVIVYQGFYEDGHLAFDRVPLGTPNNLIHFPLPGGGSTQLFVSNIDYPAVDDLDCDGDLDILTFDPAGGFVEFYENQSVEEGYGLDSLHFRLADDCWGGFFESGITPEVDLSPIPGGCVDALEGVAVRHAGSTLLTLDADGDGDRELILGDLSFDALNFLHNAGSCEAAWMDRQNLSYPADRPVRLPFFPAAFYLDLTDDGVNDLAVSPNSAQEGENVEVLWWYENTGASNQTAFAFRSRDFLVGEMLDFGTDAFPAFVDFNADGLSDLVIGNGFRYRAAGQRVASLHLFENKGTPADPVFELVDSDYLDMSRFNPEGYGLVPAFGDLDGDGDLDIVVGEERGALFFAENEAGPNEPLSFGDWQYPYADIDVGQSSAPAIADLNDDGLPDLIIGERNGNLNFFPNVGGVGRPAFVADPETPPNISFLGQVDARVPGNFVGNSAPSFVKTPDGRTHLILGTETGRLEHYYLTGPNLAEAFPLESDQWGQIREGSRSKAALADIDGDGLLEAAIGNARGGIAVYRSDLESDQTVAVSSPVDDMRMQVYPNPGSEMIFLHLTKEAIGTEKVIRIFNAAGQLVRRLRSSESLVAIPVKALSPGLYFLQARMKTGTFLRKIIIRR